MTLAYCREDRPVYVNSSAQILLVEDDLIIQLVLETYLQEAGFTVITAASGREALDIIAVTPLGAIFTDIRLGSGADGWDVADGARQRFPDIPVLYMTGDSAHDWAARGKAGSKILVKPFAPDLFIETVTDLLQTDCHPVSGGLV